MTTMDDLTILMDGSAEMGGVDTIDVPVVRIEIQR